MEQSEWYTHLKCTHTYHFPRFIVVSTFSMRCKQDNCWWHPTKNLMPTMIATSTRHPNSFPIKQKAYSQSPFIDNQGNQKKQQSIMKQSSHNLGFFLSHQPRKFSFVVPHTPRQPKLPLGTKQTTLSSLASMVYCRYLKVATPTSV